jgi:hypothetical protein
MISLLKALAVKLVAGRTVGGVFGLLTILLVPLAGVLKFIGLPLLIVLGVIGAPVFLLLGAIGLPLLLVVGIGGIMMLFIGAMLTIGLIAFKIALPIILVVCLLRWFRRKPSSAPVVPADAEPVADEI